MSLDFAGSLQLWDRGGRRKYLTLTERVRFMQMANARDGETKLFCLVMALTGARISEVLQLTPQQLDPGMVSVIFRTLKRRQLIFRSVPLPAKLMRELVALTWSMPRDEPIWRWCRQTAWQRVKDVMQAAGIEGIHATPKGLRHAFGIAAAEKNITLAVIARWMGHSSVETTMIYLEALGQEERRFARRLWHDYARL